MLSLSQVDHTLPVELLLEVLLVESALAEVGEVVQVQLEVTV